MSSSAETISHFEPNYPENITSTRVKDLSTFVVAHQNYLAISGDDPALYKIKPNGKLLSDLRNKFGPVDKWIVINVNTYRDDILLLAHEQGAKSIKLLTWRGSHGGFVQLSDSPCSLDDKEEGHASICRLKNWFGRCTDFLLGPVSSSFPTLLVPYENGTSKLYSFKTILQPQDNPVLFEINKFKDRRSFLQEIWDKEKEQLRELESRRRSILKHNTIDVNTTSNENETANQNFTENIGNENYRADDKKSGKPAASLDDLRKKITEISHTIEMIRSELENRNDIGSRLRNFGKGSGYITVNGKTIVKKAEFSGKLNETPVFDLLHDTFRIDRPKRIRGTKTINILKADKISFKNVGNISADDLIFSDGPIIIEGNLTLKKNLVVDGDIVLSSRGKINGIDLSKDALQFDKAYTAPLKFSRLETSNILVEKVNGTDSSYLKAGTDFSKKNWNRVNARRNLTVNKINGKDWKRTIESAVWLNKNTHITGVTTVNGIINTQDLYFDSLNGETYEPEHTYNLYSRSSKDFPATSEDVNSSLYRDDRFSSEVNRTKKFFQTEDSFTRKKEKVFIKGDLIVNHLTVNGILSTVKKNKGEWSDSLKDIVYKTDSNPVIIKGKKTFSKGLDVNATLLVSGLVNNNNVSDFLTVDSFQVIKGVEKFNKFVSFNEILVSGTWDGINITESIFKATNNFYRGLPSHSLMKYEMDDITDVNHEISEANNPITTEEFLNERNFDGKNPERIFFLDLNATTLEVIGNIELGGLLGGVNLTAYKNSIDSTASGNQNTDDIKTTETLIDDSSEEPNSHLNMHGTNDNHCIRYIKPEDMNFIKIKELIVEGNIETIEGISGYNISDINRSAIGLERNNNVDGEIIFKDEVECEVLAVHGFINNEFIDFKSLNEDIVKKTDKDIVITGKKTFTRGNLFIDDDVELESINDVNVSDLLRKDSNHQTIAGKLNIKGKVTVTDQLIIKGYLNNTNFTSLMSKYKNLGEGIHQWNGDVRFKKPVVIDKLTVNGLVNDEDFTRFATNAFTDNFQEDRQIIFSGAKAFKGNVTIIGDLKISNNFNDIDFNEFLDDIVYVNQPSTIKEAVTFSQKIIFHEGLNIDYDLNVSMIYGCDLKQLSQNAVHLDETDVIVGSLVFESATSGGNIKASLVNDLDLKQALFLNKEQTIFNTLQFDKITVLNDVPVGHLVNGLRLEEEYKNTLLVETDQIIYSKFFVNGNVAIKGNLITNKTVNDKLIQNVARLKENNTFSGPFTFDCVYLNEELQIKSNNLSGIDVQNWERRAVFKDNDINISAQWNIMGNIIFNSLQGTGKLNNIDIISLNNELALWKTKQLKLQYETKSDYLSECTAVKSMMNKASAQLYELQNFEISQILTSQSFIKKVHLITVQHDTFLIISRDTNCMLSFYKWNKVTGLFETYFEQHGFTSAIKIISAEYDNKTFLIAKFMTDLEKPFQQCNYEKGIILLIYSLNKLQVDFVQRVADDDDELLSDNSNYKNGTFYTVNKVCINKWSIKKMANGNYSAFKKCLKNYHEGLKSTEHLNKYSNQQFDPLSNITVSDNRIITEYNINPRTKYVAVAVVEYPQLTSRTDLVKIYNSDGSLYHKIVALKPHALNWLDIMGQNWITFIENGTSLQIYQLEDTKTGFINRLSYNVSSINSITGLVPMRNKLNSMPIIVLHTSANSIYIIKGNMAGDPYHGSPPNCDVNKGIS